MTLYKFVDQRKKLGGIEKINDFVGPMKEMSLQGKPPQQNLKKRADQEICLPGGDVARAIEW